MAIEATISLRGISPLALHRTRAGRQFTETLDYVSGSTLRGALADAYLAQHNADDPDFKDLFISGKVSYPDLWPTLEGTNTTLLPLSARACKRYGFDHLSSVSDGLLARAYQSTGSKMSCQAVIATDKNVKEKCNADLDRARGYLSELASKTPLRLVHRLRMNVAMERAIGSQASGFLFSHQTVQTHTKKEKSDNKKAPLLFTGTVRVESKELYEALKTFAPKDTPLGIGASRTRGLGEVEIAGWEECRMMTPNLSERWKEFNKKATAVGAPKGMKVFSITLMSHLILRDELLLPKLEDEEKELDSSHFRLRSNLKCTACFTNAVVVAGWNAALGMPKPDSVALCRGSVWLFEAEEQCENDILKQLQKLEEEGLGERRVEGFGRMLACAPFHYQHNEVSHE